MITMSNVSLGLPSLRLRGYCDEGDCSVLGATVALPAIRSKRHYLYEYFTFIASQLFLIVHQLIVSRITSSDNFQVLLFN